MPRTPFSGISEYRKVGVESGVESATPHRLIEMLLDGAIERIKVARGCMERGEIARKCEAIDWSLTIIGSLHASLDRAKGGQIATNLADLYEYMMHRLVEANATNDLAILDEVTRLMGEIRDGWAGIRT